MQKAKKLLALVLSVALLLSFLPVLPVAAEGYDAFSYADQIGVVKGTNIFSHDYLTMEGEDNGKYRIPNADDTNYGWYALAAVTGTKRVVELWGTSWPDPRNITYNMENENYVARIKFYVNTAQTQNGTISFNTIGTNSSGENTIVSYLKFGMSNRTAGDPHPGNVIIYQEDAQYGFYRVNGVTPFVSGCEYPSFTLEIYCINGSSYYLNGETGELLGAAVHMGGSSLETVNKIQIVAETCAANITAIDVFELEEAVPTEPFDREALNTTTGFELGEQILDVNFAKQDAGSTPEGWTFSSASIGTGSGKTAAKNVLRLNNNYGNSRASFNLNTGNFAAVVTAGIDYNQTLSGTLTLGITDTNGTTAAYWGLGLPKRSSEQMLKAGKSCVSNYKNYYYPATGDYTYTESYTTVTMVMYSYDNIIYCYWPDGTFVYSVAVNPDTDLSEGCTVYLGNDWATAYIHSISVYDIIPFVPPFESGLVEGSGFIADQVYYDLDFSKLTASEIPEGWTFNSSRVGTGSGESGSKNVLRLSNDWGYSNATMPLDLENFAATITVGIDYSQKLAGTLIMGVKDADGVNASHWGLGLPKRSSEHVLKAGKSVINKGTGTYDYHYPAAGAYEFSTTGYTTLEMVMYLYEGTFYYFWGDGTFVDSVTASAACDLSKGINFYFANDYATAYIHDLKIYEIIPNSFNVDSAAIAIKDNEPVINFNMSYDNSLKNVISDEGMEFGAIITVNDTSITTDTTIDTENAIIWNFEKGEAENDVFKFAEEMALSSDILDKYINVRLFVKNAEMYNYSKAVSYCPAQLADIFYRSTQSEAEKDIIDQAFASSNVFLGKESKKTTFTVFSDFHYKQGMYISSIADMNTIMDRANASGSSFVLSAGDMCNDIIGSPELINAFKNNKYGIPVANVYGNHEMESGGNSMQVVTPTLTNIGDVVWGTEDGSYDANIAYYYFEIDGFRIICTDTNYSWNPTMEVWEHSKPASWGPPSGNSLPNSLGPVQMQWLTDVLNDAAENDIPCIVMSHASFKADWTEQSNDAAAVQKIFDDVNKLNPGTVMMHISGHAHDDIIENVNGIIYFRVNTTRNTYWKSTATEHYGENDTFMMETYDSEGNFLGYEETPIASLVGGKQTHFSDSPLSATVTIDECGIITINGMTVGWLNDVEPDLTGVTPNCWAGISNYANFDCANGHVWADDYTVDGDVHYKECIHPECTITDVVENAYYGEHEFVNGECVCGKADGTTETFAQGDINGDGNVDAADLALIKKVIAKLTPIDDPDVKQPDVDGVGEIPDAADLALLKKIIAKLV